MNFPHYCKEHATSFFPALLSQGCRRCADAALEAYAKEEREEDAIVRADDEWDLDDEDPPCRHEWAMDGNRSGTDMFERCEKCGKIKTDKDKPTPLAGLIVDTREWDVIYPSDLESLNLSRCRMLIITTTGQLGINRYLSASNFRARRGN